VILINDSLASDRNLQATVAHELFHVLEYAHSYAAADTWIGEASATWAEHLFAPTDDHRTTYFKAFQATPGPLTRMNGKREYGAEAWLLWLQQTSSGMPSGEGGQSSVFELWQSFDNAPGSAVQNLIDADIPWAAHFRDFALEDLNLKLGGAVRLAFSDADPKLPVDITPDWVRDPWPVPLDQARTTGVRLGPLAAQYDWIGGVDARVRDVRFTFSSDLRQTYADVTVVGEFDGKWQVIRVESGQSIEFCRDLPGNSANQFYVIVDNSDCCTGAKLVGDYSVAGFDHCPTPSY
jgi:hypothetical protein